jgi:hypothetical protein
VRLFATLASAAALLALPSAARAVDPGRWAQTGRSTVPLEYYQGIASDSVQRPSLFFSGIHVGLYRTDSQLRETGRANDVIPLPVTAAERYNHIGDIAYDSREGGRVLLPMECYYPNAAPGQSDPNNTCRTGSIAVADPRTLQWRYYVKLDPAEIPKAMWAAVSPDGELLWTQSGADLLAYSLDDVKPSNAAPGAPPIKAVRRLPGARPPSGITGAAFHEGRLYVAGQDNPVGFQVWSIDLATGERRLEIERVVIGESEGIDFFSALGGELHWIVAPYNNRALPSEGPAYTSTLLHFTPKGTGAPPPVGGRQSTARIRVAVTPRRARAGARTRFRFRATALIAGRRRPVARAEVRFAGRRVRTDRAGRASMSRRLPRAGRYRVRASRSDLRPGTATVRLTPRRR